MTFLNLVITTALFGNFIQQVFTLTLLEPNDITTPKLIRKAGYPIEKHKVTTNDGYILTMHRIPYSPKNTLRNDGTASPVAFLQHGFVASSTDWIGLGPPDALGYFLSDSGYDVWMGNSRGSRYSLQHVQLDASSPVFWNFSYHEMGVYDLPAAFEYIRKKTGVDKLDYIGHSQGATEFFVYCSMVSTCKTNINSAHLLAPVVFTKHWPNSFVDFARTFGQPDPLSKLFGSFNIAPNTRLLHRLGETYCSDFSNTQSFCANFIFAFIGPSNYLNESMIPFLSAIYPADSSFKQARHFFQNHVSGKFRQYDYGPLLNLQSYGSSEPDEYNLKRIYVPLYLYYSESDFLGPPEDAIHLAKVLPKGIVRGIFRVRPKKWNHFDFLYGLHVKDLLYNKLLINLKGG